MKANELGTRADCSERDESGRPSGRTSFKVPAGATRSIRLRASKDSYPGLKQGAADLQATLLLKSAGGSDWLRATAKIRRSD